MKIRPPFAFRPLQLRPRKSQSKAMSGSIEKVSHDGSDPQLVKPSANSYDLGERRRAALADVDNAKFSWFHAKVCAVAGVGFFTDAYDIFAINIASTMLGYVYGADRANHALNPDQDLGVKVATPVGTLVGQLLFGWLADLVGRKRMYGVELMIMIIATFGQALSGSGPAVHVIGALIVWRFIMGVGIGGDYPLSAVISSEFASTRIRGRMMNAVFASQGWGNFCAALVGIIVVSAYKSTTINDQSSNLGSIDPQWRLLIGLGCVPGVVALYFRLTIPETPRFTMDIERNIERATADVKQVLDPNVIALDDDAVTRRVQVPKASWADFRRYFSEWKNLKILIGTSYSWFALDIAFYGLGLNSGIILQTIGFGSPAKGLSLPVSAFQNMRNICVGNLILSAAGLIPGYWVCFLFVDSWGRKPIQLMGFIMLTIIFVIMGFGYDKLTATPATTGAFVFLYCLANFFQNFGPNTTTFIIPGEVFPTRYRSTAHGISAASGKLGAIVAQVGFARLKDIGGKNHFVKHILEIFAFFMLTGIFSTLLLPETKGKTLEELSNEDQDGFVQGEERPRVV
ncbi:Inorganic phosphate transporter pho84 [Pleurotus pulmonarius]|nr:Inorganic phosphate transporter pho84 [Pleurotus pulmonarius]